MLEVRPTTTQERQFVRKLHVQQIRNAFKTTSISACKADHLSSPLPTSRLSQTFLGNIPEMSRTFISYFPDKLSGHYSHIFLFNRRDTIYCLVLG